MVEGQEPIPSFHFLNHCDKRVVRIKNCSLITNEVQSQLRVGLTNYQSITLLPSLRETMENSNELYLQANSKATTFQKRSKPIIKFFCKNSTKTWVPWVTFEVAIHINLNG